MSHLTNKQHLAHLSFSTNFTIQPLGDHPSWPQLQRGPAAPTPPDPTARQLRRAPEHRGRRCCSSRGEAAANCCFPSAPLPRPGSGRQHRDGLPFSTAKAQRQIQGKSTGGARPKPTSSGSESLGNLSQATKKCVFNFQHAFARRKRPGWLHTDLYASLAMLGSDLWLGERPTRRAYVVAQPTVAELCGGTASDQTMPNHSL